MNCKICLTEYFDKDEIRTMPCCNQYNYIKYTTFINNVSTNGLIKVGFVLFVEQMLTQGIIEIELLIIYFIF